MNPRCLLRRAGRRGFLNCSREESVLANRTWDQIRRRWVRDCALAGVLPLQARLVLDDDEDPPVAMGYMGGLLGEGGLVAIIASLTYGEGFASRVPGLDDERWPECLCWWWRYGSGHSERSMLFPANKAELSAWVSHMRAMPPIEEILDQILVYEVLSI
jgi:hypothetical protein